MCLAAAIEAAPDPELEQLRKLLPRLGKLVKNEGFKGKAAVIGVIGSVVAVGGAGGKGILDWLVPSMVELLSSEDWMARKAAAEAMRKVAVAEKELAPEFKASCLKALENRRFDKVKVVRETMNRALESWKEVPSLCEDIPAVPSQKSSSSKDDGSLGCFSSVGKCSNKVGLKSPRPKKVVPTSRSPPSNASLVTGVKKEFLLNSTDRNQSSSMLCRKLPKCEADIAESRPPSSKEQGEDIKMIDRGVKEAVEKVDDKSSGPETKRVLFSKNQDDKVHKFGGLRSGSRVVPYHNDDIPDVGISNMNEEVCENGKDNENLSMIHEQLAQIENQQSSLLNLLQKFMGSSQSGINSLETRVNGLEMALDEISYDLAMSSGRFPNTDPAGNTCCNLPGTEFLSPKFWRKTEARFSSPRYSPSNRRHSLGAVQQSSEGTHKAFQRYQYQSGDEFAGYSPVNACSDPKEKSGFYLNRTSKSIRVSNASNSNMASSVSCTASVNLSSR